MDGLLAILNSKITIDGALIALVVWVVWAIFTDRLVPYRRLKEQREETDRWHNAYDTLEKAHSQSEKQNTLLLEQSALTVHVLRSLGTGTFKDSDFKSPNLKEGGEV